MMLYAITGYDAPNSLEPRRTAHAAHMARLAELEAENRIVLAGPCLAVDSPDPAIAGFSGSLIVASFDSLAAAQAWIDSDPFVTAGVYARVTVQPFRQVLPRL